ncbi:MAG TPA: ABC transporter substrate-binding protein [Pseudolabrys sp.]|jgi:putative ABC transport system substrate-binding protein|nr:ABC transporter substrate-binding protein [Pseudolabrys sp.]
MAVRAQPSALPVIGFLHSATANAYALMTAALRKSLSEAGYVEGQNVAIEYRWAEGQFDRLPEMAADLVRHQVSVIFAGGGSDPSLAAKAATSKIPIVFANGTDPVAAGLVASLDHPGANVTGITFLLNTLGPKELEVIHELVPKAALVAVLINPKSSTAASQLKDLQDTARAFGQEVSIFNASAESEIENVFGSLAQLKPGGLVIGADAFFFSRRGQFVDLATRYSIPTIYPWREAVAAGGLASYGSSVTDAYRLAGIYIGRILKGDKAANLPVQQSTKTELVINLKTAKLLGLNVPNTLVGRADELIE